MSKDYDSTTSLLDDLTQDEVETLASLVGGLDRLEMLHGAPRYSAEEIDLIGRFANLPEDDDDETDEEEDEEIDDETDLLGANAAFGTGAEGDNQSV